jgi:hypothetical protein
MKTPETGGTAGRHPVGRTLVTLCCIALLLAGCMTDGGPTPAGDRIAQANTETRSADDLLVVDCTLPAPLRKLGSRVSFLGPRRAIKTSGSDCEIRGGEYAAYDRADYRTALNVWLPLAETGDPQAQTYVGEIFERGSGGSPDYSAAAVWYKRAADQGFRRAQTNLASLYETGRGVPQDRSRAVMLYRSAAGMTAADFASLGLDEQAVARAVVENEGLRRELETERARLADLRGNIERQQAREQNTRIRLQTLEADRRRLLQQSWDIQTSTQAAVDPAAAAAARQQAEKLNKDLALRRQEIAALTDELAMVRNDLRRNQEQAAERLARAEVALRSDRGQQSAESLRLQQEVTQARSQITQLQQELDRRRVGESQLAQQLAVAEQHRTQLMGQLEAASRNRNDAEVLALRQKLTEQEAVLTDRTQAMEQMQNELQQLQTRITANIQQTAAVLGSSRDAGRNQVPAAENVRLMEQTRSIFGRYYALVIGNNDYAKLPHLETAVEDARDVARALQDNYGFETKLLVNASRYDILSALNEFRAKLTENDNFVLYYAGHGELDRVNQRGHWLPVDAEPDNSANWIPVVSITDILNAMSVKHALVVADSCYSGILTRTSLTNLASGMSAEAQRHWLETMAQNRVRVVLTSGGVAPVMDGGGGENSVFAKSLVEVLGDNHDILSGYDLYRRVAAEVNQVAKRYGFEQVPEYAPIQHAGHETGDFFFIPLLTVTTAKTST